MAALPLSRLARRPAAALAGALVCALGAAGAAALPLLVWGRLDNIDTNANLAGELAAIAEGQRPLLRWPQATHFGLRALIGAPSALLHPAAWPAVGAGLHSGREVFHAVFPGHKQQQQQIAAKEAADEKVVNLGEAGAAKAKPHKSRGKGGPLPIKGLIPGMAIHYAGCCHPLPGDRIVGIVTTGRGVTVHTIDCDTLEPFFCGTYYPKPQFLQLLGAVAETWRERRDEVGDHEPDERMREEARRERQRPALAAPPLIDPQISACIPPPFPLEWGIPSKGDPP
jgi:hypothetical protein